MTITIIAAMSSNRVIGKDGVLPWRIPSDLKRFKEMTTGAVVVMGRKTFESIGSKPLPNRYNVVITKNTSIEDVYVMGTPRVMVFDTLEKGLETSKSLASLPGAKNEIFIIGGNSLYKDCLPVADRICLTVLGLKVQGDVTFPDFQEEDWNLVSNEIVTDPYTTIHDDVPENKGTFHTVTYQVKILERKDKNEAKR